MIHSSSNLLITREWSMPNSNTFDIKPIHKLISKYIKLVKAGNPSAVLLTHLPIEISWQISQMT